MALRLKLEGSTWHIRGTIRVGRESVRLRESTGCHRRQDAERHRDRREREVLEALLRPAARGPSFAEAVALYVGRPGERDGFDLAKIKAMLLHFKETPWEGLHAGAWSGFTTEKLPGRKASSINRYRALFMAIIHYAAERHGIEPPKIPKEKEPPMKPPPWLEPKRRDALLSAYPEHTKALFAFYAGTGARKGEALALEWRDVNMDLLHVVIGRSKNGTGRMVRLPTEVHRLLYQTAADFEPGAKVFRNSNGQPWHAHGKAISDIHAETCRKVGIEDFTVHDWRHHWATNMVMKGTPLRLLMELGGWKSINMVLRYTHFSPQQIGWDTDKAWEEIDLAKREMQAADL